MTDGPNNDEFFNQIKVGNLEMTLRDYFAAHAPTAVKIMSFEDHCAWRYRYADAMLKAREKS